MKRKSILHNFLGTFSNFVFLFLTSFALLPYYFRYISAADYGIWLGGISFLTLVNVFEANISLILTQQLGEKWTNNKTLEFSKYLSSALFFGLVASLIIIVSTFFFKDTLTSWVSPDNKVNHLFSDSFQLYAISLSMTITFGYLNTVTQVFLKTLLSPIFNLLASFVGISYTIWAIPREGVLAIATGNLIKGILYSLLVCIYVIKLLKERNIQLNFEFRYVLKLLRNISFPFISKVGMTLAMNIQNFIIAVSISANATTIYDVTKKMPLLTQSVVNMIAMATFTSFSLHYSEKRGNGGAHEYTKIYFSLIKVLLLFSLTCVFIFGQDFVTIWVGKDKFGGNILLALLCMTSLSDQLRMVLSQQYYAIGKFNLTAITDSIFAMSFIGSALLLIPKLGLNGLVIAGILGNIAYFVSCFIIEKRFHINLVSNIITISLFTDLIVVAIVLSIAKLINSIYFGNYIVGLFTIIIPIIVLSVFFLLKERTLFTSLVKNFWNAKINGFR